MEQWSVECGQKPSKKVQIVGREECTTLVHVVRGERPGGKVLTLILQGRTQNHRRDVPFSAEASSHRCKVLRRNNNIVLGEISVVDMLPYLIGDLWDPIQRFHSFTDSPFDVAQGLILQVCRDEQVLHSSNREARVSSARVSHPARFGPLSRQIAAFCFECAQSHGVAPSHELLSEVGGRGDVPGRGKGRDEDRERLRAYRAL